MQNFGIASLSAGYSKDYFTYTDETEFDPRVSNEFATAAFRIHSLIPPSFDTIGKSETGDLNLRDAFNQPQKLRKDKGGNAGNYSHQIWLTHTY